MGCILTELADAIARTFLIIFEMLRQVGEVSETWKRINVTLVLKREELGNYRPLGSSSVAGNIENILLENISKHMKDKK